jgi:hypothetical protein
VSYPDPRDELNARADRELGEEYRAEQRQDRAADHAPAPEPTDAVLAGALDFLRKVKAEAGER